MHEAFEMTSCFFGIVSVMIDAQAEVKSAPSAGALITTLLRAGRQMHRGLVDAR